MIKENIIYSTIRAILTKELNQMKSRLFFKNRIKCKYKQNAMICKSLSKLYTLEYSKKTRKIFNVQTAKPYCFCKYTLNLMPTAHSQKKGAGIQLPLCYIADC